VDGEGIVVVQYRVRCPVMGVDAGWVDVAAEEGTVGV